mgnify:CR=1 FL=1
MDVHSATNQQPCTTSSVRRRFLHGIVTLFGVSCLGFAGTCYLKVQKKMLPANGFLFLDQPSADLITLLIKDTQLSSHTSVDNAVLLRDIDEHMSRLPSATSLDLQRLLQVLQFYPIRVLSGISEGKVESIEHPYQFLSELRNSRLAPMRVAYRFLVSSIQLHLYKYEEAWPKGYIGLQPYVKKHRAHI